VPDASPDGAELEKLLMQLLRVVSPGLATHGGYSAPHAGSAALEASADQAADGVAVPASAQPPASASASASAADPEPRRGPAETDVGAPAVSASEARALIELVAARGIAQGELATLLGLDKSTVSRLAAGLERKGWIRRGRDEENQRYVRLYLTPQGRDVAGRVWQGWQSRQARILAALSADERAGLSAGLGGLVRGLAAEGLLSEPTGHGTKEQAARP
jgi:DNA-binding MarR family transcriptional regulator